MELGRELVRDLVDKFPTFRPLLDEHLECNEELLAYEFMGDVTRSLVAACERPGGSDFVTQVLVYLEQAYLQGAGEVVDLIALGVIENLPSTGEPGSGIRKLLGPRLAAEFRLLNW